MPMESVGVVVECRALVSLWSWKGKEAIEAILRMRPIVPTESIMETITVMLIECIKCASIGRRVCRGESCIM